MFAGLQAKLIAGAAIVGSIFLAALKLISIGREAEGDKIKAKTEKAARDNQKKATDALIDGTAKEQKVMNEKVDPDKSRDHFS